MRAHKIIIVPYTAAAMYALADDIEHYPQFLPWCAGAEVARDGEQVNATLHIRYMGLSTSFATANIHTPFSSIDMQLASGPLTALKGGWRFTDLGDGRSRVEFDLHYEFAGGMIGTLFAKVFQVAFSQFVDCFVARARECYGENGTDKNMTISIVDADNIEMGEQQLQLPAGATLEDALRAAGKSDVESAGIFGRECHRQTPLYAGARVEIYRPLMNDPREARRMRDTKADKSKT